MKYKTIQSGSDLIVKISGAITFDDHENMKALISDVEDNSSDQVEVDMQELSAIDSAGIGLLLLLNDRVKAFGGALVLRNIPPVPGKILEVAKIGEIIEIR